MTFIRRNLGLTLVFAFWFFALFNPVFKKYDYGAGLPLIFIFSFLMVFVLILEWRRERERALVEKILLAVFAISYIVAFHFSMTKNLSFPETLAYLSVIPLYLLYANQKIDDYKKIFTVLIIAGFMSAVLGFVQYFLLDPTRMVGPFMNILYHANFWPNAFAMFLLMIWPFFIVLFDSKMKTWVKIFMTAFVVAALMLTFSRGAMIAAVGQIVLLIIFFWRRLNKKVFINFIIVAFLAFSIFSLANYIRSMAFITIDVGERISFENNEILTSGQERVDFWKGAIDLADDKPLTGYGPFSFRYAFNPLQKVFLGASDHPHNIFLKFAAENGLINASAFILFLFYVLFLFLKRFKNLSPQKKKYASLIVVSICGTFAHNLIDYNFNFFASLILVFILLAVLRSLVVDKSKVKQRPPYLASFLIVIVVFATFWEGLHLYLGDKALDTRLYARFEYLSTADDLFQKSDFAKSISYLDKQIELNPLDSQAYYLKGVIYCNQDFSEYSLDLCESFFNKALSLNPQNDVNYYLDYLRVLIRQGKTSDDVFEKHVQKSMKLFNLYFGYVKFNVHFTSFTTMVESAEEMGKILTEYAQDEEEKNEILWKISMMQQYAKEHRGGKEAI